MLSSNACECASDLRSHVAAIVACDPATAGIDESGIQALLGAVVQLYAARVDRVGKFAGVTRGSITATDALITASALLKAVNVAPFELGLWEAWS